MDEQTSATPEPVTITPDLVVVNSPTVEPPQEATQAVAETPQIEAPSEPLPATLETPTPHLPVDEALPETTSEPVPQGSVAPATEVPKVETPTAPVSPPEEPPQIQQGTTQPEPSQKREPPASHPESLPAQAPQTVTPPKNILLHLLTKAHLVTQLRKQKKLVKIMTLFAKKNHITNDDVEKLLHVSDATASRYLGHLTKENKITQVGKTGQGVTYTKR